MLLIWVNSLVEKIASVWWKSMVRIHLGLGIFSMAGYKLANPI